MNYIKQLTAVLEKFTIDNRLNPTHVSLYLALFQYWNLNRFKNPISISRQEIIGISKIGSKATYHKCINELNCWGYLTYKPSHNPFRGSQVIMFNFCPSSEQALVHSRSLNEQATAHNSSDNEQALESSKTYINNKQRTIFAVLFSIRDNVFSSKNAIIKNIIKKQVTCRRIRIKIYPYFYNGA